MPGGAVDQRYRAGAPEPEEPPTPPLTGRATVAVLIVGLIVAAVVTGAVGVVLSAKSPHYTASAKVTLVTAPGTTADLRSKYQNLLEAGGPINTAAAVFGEPALQDAAATKAGVDASALTIAAVAGSNSSEVDLTVTGPSAQAAETAAQALIDAATTPVQTVTGPYTLSVIGSPAGSAVVAGTAVSVVLLFVFPITLLIACAVALGIRQFRAGRAAKRSADPQ